MTTPPRTRPALAIRQDQPPSNLDVSDYNNTTAASRTSSTDKLSSFRKLRQTFSYAGRKKSTASQRSDTASSSIEVQTPGPSSSNRTQGTVRDDPYAQLRAATPTQGWNEITPQGRVMEDVEEAYEWERETDVGENDNEENGGEGYRWVEGQGGVDGDQARQNGTYDIIQLNSPTFDGGFPRLPPIANSPTFIPTRPKLMPEDSYALLLSFQSHSSPPPSGSVSASAQPSSVGHGSISMSLSGHRTDTSRDAHGKPISGETEWHELVDEDMVRSLGREERRRQGLWWELIKGEREYVGDLGTMVQGFIEPLLHHVPPILEPDTRLRAFVQEVFSSAQAIYAAHSKLLDQLLDRQRNEWPLLTSIPLSSATDLLLGTMLDVASIYETYMKNYPFADSRVRREKSKNPRFRSFINERTTLELTRRRDVSVFLSRPVTRLPRMLLLLEQILKYTPTDHPDREELPTLIQVTTEAVKSSQPGIESAEAKIKLWNVAERLLFRRGEIIELDMAEPKRGLVYSGYVFRRVRNETSWHGWQDVHVFLLDNYFLLTRDEEHGRHVVVSRPIPLDFLVVLASDGAPERRSDFGSSFRGSSSAEAHPRGDRLMYPFTISTSSHGGGRTYTLCAGTEQGRQAWVERIESTKTLRRFDMESNRIFTLHSLSTPSSITEPIFAADTFEWLGRSAVAIATSRSIWVGWKRDAGTFRELARLNVDLISCISVVPDFGWMLVLSSGRLYAFDLKEMVPTHDPSTWVMQGLKQGKQMGDIEKQICFVRVGYTKGRLLVVYASHSKTSHTTHLTFEEPLASSASTSSSSLDNLQPFRRFATLSLPGYASDLSFFRQTIAVVMEKQFIIAEPGNPAYNTIPSSLSDNREAEQVSRLIGAPKARALGMFQVGENEFVLVWDWGACYVTKYGEIARQGNYLRWNLTPSYCSYRAPQHMLLYDEAGGRVEVRDVMSGRMCEVVDHPGLRPVHMARSEGDVLGLTPKGLVQVVETVEL